MIAEDKILELGKDKAVYHNFIWLKEYEALRAEILQDQRLRIWVLSITFTAIGVIIGIPISFGPIEITSGFDIVTVFLPSVAAYVVLLTGLSIVTLLCESSAFKGRYIECFLEPLSEGSLAWETRLTLYKTREKDLSKLRGSPKTSTAYFTTNLGLCVITFFYGISRWVSAIRSYDRLLQIKSNIDLYYTLIVLVGIMYLFAFGYSSYLLNRLKNVNQKRPAFYKAWDEIKKSEKTKGNQPWNFTES